jgi:hypothetical protein
MTSNILSRRYELMVHQTVDVEEFLGLLDCHKYDSVCSVTGVGLSSAADTPLRHHCNVTSCIHMPMETFTQEELYLLGYNIL